MHNRVLQLNDPYAHLEDGENVKWHSQGRWPCSWVSLPDPPSPPFVAAYRLRFDLVEPAQIRAHVSADERYDLFVDGCRIGRGSGRGSPAHWYFETYELNFTAGRHLIVARVWTLGKFAPYAQMSIEHGFILGAEGEFLPMLSTGLAGWEAKRLGGYAFSINPMTAIAGAQEEIDGEKYDWDFETGAGEGWTPVAVLEAGSDGRRRKCHPLCHLLHPAPLPPMLDIAFPPGRARHAADLPAQSDPGKTPIRNADHQVELTLAWQSMLEKRQPFNVPAHRRIRILLDLEQYVCAYPLLVVGKGLGARLRLSWAESLFVEPPPSTGRSAKGHRGEIENKYFAGPGDVFCPDGGGLRRFAPLWWRAGRYLELLVETGAEPVTIMELHLQETRYPLEMDARIECSDKRWNNIVPNAVRALQMCAHETYLDCPFYEQLMYSGDTRLAALATYVISGDDRLPRKAINVFYNSRLPCGATQSRYPCRGGQLIPSFSLWWIGMVHDFAMWRGDMAFIRGILPAVRMLVEWLLGYCNADGLIQNGDGTSKDYFGWNFYDWVPAWRSGVPPDGDHGVSSLLNWHYVLATRLASELESMAGDAAYADRMRAISAAHAKIVHEAFWDERRGMFADDLKKNHYSEHAQCLAILSGQLDDKMLALTGQALIKEKYLRRTTISFTHYYFEACRLVGCMDLFFARLGLWEDAVRSGLKTLPEWPEPTRSDCHGWGAHVLYHYFALILGIRPASFGFETVHIRPQLGPLSMARGRMPHPAGQIEMEARRVANRIEGVILLPPGISGTVEYQGATQRLSGDGRNEFSLG